MAACNTCGTDKAHVVNVRLVDGKWTDFCNLCAEVSAPTTYDAYLPKGGGVHMDEHLADPKTGKPIPYSTKGEKAAIMKRLGVREAGDARHGAKNRSTRRTYFL